jgi:AcrR family transcriptional regulator
MASGGTTKRMGRPRRFDPDRERTLLLTAAMSVMRRNGFASASVADILDEAGLSTRAFYRHFESKDDLVGALYQGDAERTAARLAEKVGAASSSRAGLEAWVEEVLSLAYDARRAQRVSVMASEAARRSVTEDTQRRAQSMLTAPLLAILEAGVQDGSFPAADPANDALTIHRLAFGLVLEAVVAGRRLNREEAKAHVLRFSFGALGLTGSNPLRP